jgi:hypothetical protein
MPLNTKAQTISETIRDLVDEYNQHPYDINDGNCECFALDVQKRYPEVTVFWGDAILELFPKTYVDPSPHCFVYYKGRFYDAEEPDGTLHPMFLPFYFRVAGKEDFPPVFTWLEKTAKLSEKGLDVPMKL